MNEFISFIEVEYLPFGRCLIRMALKRGLLKLDVGSCTQVNSISSPTVISRLVSRTSVKWKNKRTLKKSNFINYN